MPMDNQRFFDMAQAILIKCVDVMATKGKEYTESSDNKLANFEAEAEETSVPVLDIIHIFANKHQKAINNYRKTGQVESEALEMRFVDRINYLILELAECIAQGYEPREEWLIESLGLAEGRPSVVNESGVSIENQGGADFGTGIALDVPAPEVEEECCGVPGHDQCCRPNEGVPPNAGPDEQREKTQPKARQRRPRRRRPNPQGEGFATDDQGVPIAKPDSRYDPDALRERARARQPADE